MKLRVAARRAALSVVLVSGALAIGAAPAGALPSLNLLRGPLVSFGCANPANHGLLGRVLGAVGVKVGGPLRCFGQAVSATSGKGPELMSGPVGLRPVDLQSAYGVSGLRSGGRTVAIVDAFDDPNAASDLAKFRSQYGLPACTAASGCFKKINENGAGAPLPSADAGWSEEISLDLDTVSAVCPDCRIVLVEANSANTPDLGKAEDTAAAQPGVASISNSYGGAESSSQTSDDVHFNHPGVAITVSSGDSGYGVQWPASSKYVTAVGGTTLAKASTARGWTETAWSGAGSGCSAYEAKPAWQKDTGCSKRTVADVSADADPNSGLGIYDTYNTCGGGGLCDLLIQLGLVQGLDGWAQVGGTSLASPIVASVYALAGNSVVSGSFPYSHTVSLNDVVSGSNGTCSPAYLCTAGVGYDGPTGLGTPAGLGGF